MLRSTWCSAAGIFLLLAVSGGCVRREGRNSDCVWPHTEGGANQRDLIADLEFAEELAIRHMDTHYGPRDPMAAAQAKNRCMRVLLRELGKEHGITAQEAFASFGRRNVKADALMLLPLVALLAFFTDFAMRRLVHRFPPGDGWPAFLIMLLLASLAFGAIGLMVGQQWSGLAESIRVGNTHLSNRIARLPMNKYPAVAFALLVALFLGMAVPRIRDRRGSSAAG